MGWVDVEPDPYEGGSSFFKFRAVGDQLYGWWTGKAPSTGKFGGTDYTVQQKDGPQTITAKGQFLKQLEKAERNGMKLGMLVKWACTGMQDIGQPNLMPVVKVQFDPTRMQGQQQRPAQAPQPQQRPAQQPQRAPAAPQYADEDVPF